MRTARHFTAAQAQTIRRLTAIFKGEKTVLVGASALACWMDMQWRQTGDLDITVTVSFADYSRRLAGANWRQHPKLEHRWTSPDSVLVDVLPATKEILEAGRIVWESGAVMNMAGFRLALDHGEEVAILSAEPLTIHAAPVRVLAVLKMVAYLDRPDERLRDLEDLAHVLESYLDPDDPRNYDEAIWKKGLEGDQASALALGTDVRKIVSSLERERVETMLSLLIGSDDASTHLLEMAVRGPFTWHKEEARARRAVEAFAAGFAP